MKALLKVGFNQFNKQSKVQAPVERPVLKDVENTNVVSACEVFYHFRTKNSECQTQILRLLNAIETGYQFTSKDIENIFFAATNLIETQDPLLLRLALLLYRELHYDMPFMLTNSLRKVIQSNTYFMQAAAIRYFPQIFRDPATGKLYDTVLSSMNEITKSIDSFLTVKQQPPLLQSAGLMCCLALINMGYPQYPQKSIQKIKEELNAGKCVQYHAALVQYGLIRKTANGDAIRLKQLSQNLHGIGNGNALSAQVLINVSLEASNASKSAEPLLPIKSMLNTTEPIVQLDAARAILSSQYAPPDLVSSAVTRLNGLMQSGGHIAQYAALRTISRYAPQRPADFQVCNAALERLLNDNDSSISALAAICLLHTGFETVIDRVLPTIKDFSEKLSVEQQAQLLRSYVELTNRCPNKTETIIDYMWSTFRLQEEKEIQKEFVNALFSFVRNKDDKLPIILRFLCEYIEDSKFSDISIDVINFLAKKGPASQNRMEIVRALNNRLLLEVADVRSASIDALSAFAEGDYPDIPEVRKLIKSFTNDMDDEVRDRAIFYTASYQDNLVDVLELSKEKVKVAPIPVAGDTSAQQSQQHQQIAQEEEEEEEDLTQSGQLIFKSDMIDLINQDADIPVQYQVQLYEKLVTVKFFISNPIQDTQYTNIEIVLQDTDEETEGEGEDIKAPAIKEIDFSETKSTSLSFDREEGTFLTLVYKGFVQFEMDGEIQEYPFDRNFTINFGCYSSKAEINAWDQAFSQFGQEDISMYKIDSKIRFRNHDELLKYLLGITGLHAFSHVTSNDKTKGRHVKERFASMFLGKTLILFEALYSQKGVNVDLKYRIICKDGEVRQLCNDLIQEVLEKQ